MGNTIRVQRNVQRLASMLTGHRLLLSRLLDSWLFGHWRFFVERLVEGRCYGSGLLLWSCPLVGECRNYHRSFDFNLVHSITQDVTWNYRRCFYVCVSWLLRNADSLHHKYGLVIEKTQKGDQATYRNSNSFSDCLLHSRSFQIGLAPERRSGL